MVLFDKTEHLVEATMLTSQILILILVVTLLITLNEPWLPANSNSFVHQWDW